MSSASAPTPASSEARAFVLPLVLVLEIAAILVTPDTADLGCWWGALWLPPVMLAMWLTWTSRARGRLGLVLLPPLGWLLLAACEGRTAVPLGLGIGDHTIAYGQLRSVPWWATHAGMAFGVLALARAPFLRAAGVRATHVLAGLALAVGLWPWLPRPPLERFWYDCLRLRQGMTVEETIAVFDGYWVETVGDHRTEGDDHERLAVTPALGVARERFVSASPANAAAHEPAYESVVFAPFPGGDDATADLCWLTFVDGRLVSRVISPD